MGDVLSTKSQYSVAIRSSSVFTFPFRVDLAPTLDPIPPPKGYSVRMWWNILSLLLALGLFSGIALLVRRLLTKFDEYQLDESEGDGKPTAEDLLTRGGYGDPGPGG